jgi:N12 class adenine-specific DNA methylase
MTVGDDSAAGSGSVTVSGYWRNHPRHVAGTMEATGYDPAPLRVVATNRTSQVARALAAATRTLPKASPDVPVPPPSVVLEDHEGRLEGSFHVVDGQVVRVTDGRLAPVLRPSRELLALISMRDKAVALLAAEADWDCPDSSLDGPRAELADLYERYVQQFGALNRGTLSEGKVDPDTDVPRLSWRTPTLGGFRGDPQFSSVLALELFDRETGEAAPAPFLQHRVNRAPTPIVTADSPAHALAVSLAEGGINLSRIAGLLRLPDADAAEVALGPLVFRDPHTRGALVTARDYLSGNVRRKLAEARAAEALDSARYGRNVRALEDVQPAWLTPKDIRVELGSPLLDVADVRAFCVEVFGMRNVSIDHDALTAAWELDGWGMSEAATVEFGTRAKSPLQILAAGLNGKVPIVYESVTDTEGRTRQVRDGAATEAATVALSAVADRFSGWVWEDLHRARRLEVAHNERFNAHRERVADGSWLPMPRLAPWKTLRANQSDWIDYALAQPASMCCTGVGSGKTLAAIGLAVTLRDLGIARKPMVAVPNHLIEQVTVEATQSFPSARFLIVTPNDLKAGARQLFAARCATQEWDAVIITHEGLESIPVPTAVEESWLSEQLAEARAAEAGTRSSKSLARLIRSLRGRLQELRNRGRNDAGAVTFDQLGIDHLGVDEFDKYRRMPVFSRSDGFSLGSSTRATDMYLKVWWLRTHHPHRPHFSGFTATPLVNTIAEAYVYMRFCVPEVLASAGLQAFDAWAATFIRWTTLIEMSPDGSGFRCKRRPAIIQNAPELRAMLAAFMYFNPEAGERGDIPKVRYHTTTTNPTDAARTYMNSLVARAERLRAGGTSRGRNGVPGDDNFLRIVGEGRRLKPTAQKRNSQPQLAVSPTSITAPAATDFPARTSSVALSW